MFCYRFITIRSKYFSVTGRIICSNLTLLLLCKTTNIITTFSSPYFDRLFQISKYLSTFIYKSTHLLNFHHFKKKVPFLSTELLSIRFDSGFFLDAYNQQIMRYMYYAKDNVADILP